MMPNTMAITSMKTRSRQITNLANGSAAAISELSHRYGNRYSRRKNRRGDKAPVEADHETSRLALNKLSLNIDRGEIFVFLGPNGGGKTTLFRVLSTLIPQQSGEVELLGLNLKSDMQRIRAMLGVVFQAPSLDKKLTVAENMRYQAALYGLSRQEMLERERELLTQLGLQDRANERAETLSGGLRRRVELAKGMIHRPQLLLLDEPSTGLDPGARSDLWEYLQRVRREFGVTVVMTTHLLEEAEKADRIAILHEGKLAALDTPDNLKATVGGDSITIHTPEPSNLAAEIEETFAIKSLVLEDSIRFEQADGHRWVTKLVEAMPDKITSIRLGKPSLEDVFIARTGHRFWQSETETSRVE